ncbi:hypothetical protein J6590_043296 [Homalodisca vitripennis]|nr:hypothetical protein J6590_043296 [Homalodisca vitripennis]
MAAKIGAALLEGNNLLKEKTIRLEIFEEQVGRVENEENKYLSKIEDLLQNISEIQAQLEREKKLRIDTQKIFEEHDYKQGQLVDNYTKMINHLENTKHPMGTQRQTLLTTNEQIKTVEDCQALTEKLLTTGLTGKSSHLTTSRATVSTGETSQTPTEKLLNTGLTGKSSHPTTSQTSESSDDEDFNIMEVKADVHSPYSAVPQTIPFSPPKTSPPAGCNNKKPPVTATKLNPSESIQDFFY